MTLEEVQSLQAVFDRIKTHENLVCALIIGAGSHWLSVVCNKYQGMWYFELLVMGMIKAMLMMGGGGLLCRKTRIDSA